jgi:nitroreductase
LDPTDKNQTITKFLQMKIPGLSTRKPDYPIEPFFADRWSPRSFLTDPIPEEDLKIIFEAARWAPSSFNNQPWRFLYARRGTEYWPTFFDLLVEQNKGWAKNAPVLVLVISNTQFDHNGKPSPTHSFDAGAAWQNLALQAWLKGYATHGMQGFDYDAARKVLEIPKEFKVEAMIVLGKEGPKEDLPPDVQEREKPNQRRPLKETVVEGKFSSALVHLEKQ